MDQHDVLSAKDYNQNSLKAVEVDGPEIEVSLLSSPTALVHWIYAGAATAGLGLLMAATGGHEVRPYRELHRVFRRGG
ncbi:MAG: hypothetical protein AB7V46_09565 [Thermomicrobiales bacterium]